MFGLAAFSTAPFDSLGPVIIGVSETIVISDSPSSLADFTNNHTENVAIADTLNATGDFTLFVTDLHSIDDTDDNVAIYPVDVDEPLIVNEQFEGYSTQIFSFTIRGNSLVEMVSTTQFINIIEDGDAKLSISAEVHVRSL